jgi:hypothetical protein
MQKVTAKNSFRLQLVNFVWPILVLLCPLIFYIKLNGYGYWHIETFIIFFATVCLGSLLGWFFLRGGWVAKVIIFAVTITLCLSFFPDIKNYWLLVVCFIVALVFSLIFIEKLPEMIAIIAGSLFLAIILFPVGEHLSEAQWEKKNGHEASNTDLPPIIHIILDEHIGINSMPTNIPEGEQTKREVQEFYFNNNFNLYANAYSHYIHTYNSIPNLLNFTAKPFDRFYFPDAKGYSGNLRRNAYFKALSDIGYNIQVYQTDYIYFCQAKDINFSACYTYPSHSLKLVQQLPLSTMQKTGYLLKSYLLQSLLYRGFIQFYSDTAVLLGGDRAELWPWSQDQVSSLAIPATFKQLQQDVIANPQGTVFFAHMLLPHTPYIYQANCQPVLDPNQWGVNYNVAGPINTPDSRAQRYQHYNRQLLCSKNLVSDLISSLKKYKLFESATIIVQGDHGSRIALHSIRPGNIAQVIPQDYRDGYQTLFAVKYPKKSQGQVKTEVASIQQLLAEVTEKITGKSVKFEKDSSHYIYLADPPGKILKKMYKQPIPEGTFAIDNP